LAAKPGDKDDQGARLASVVSELGAGYQTVGKMVYTVLRGAIENGTFAPGEWLRQETLADAIGVSRIPVRTALLQLESEGLVTFHPHRGAQVRSISIAQIEEIYRLRLLLEPYALRLSMARMTPERLATMREFATALDSAETGPGFVDTRVEFYRAVYDADYNPLLVSMIEDLRSHVGRYLLSLHFKPAHHGRHEELVDHIAKRDLPSAEAWLYAHLENVRQSILELADEGGGEDGAGALEPPTKNVRQLRS